MRALSAILCVLLVLIQYPLWLGERSWREVWHLDAQLAELELRNARLSSDNAGLEAELRDLVEGRQAVEERARYDLGMIGRGEVFIQINEAGEARSDRVQTAAVNR